MTDLTEVFVKEKEIITSGIAGVFYGVLERIR